MVVNYDFCFRATFPDPKRAPDAATARLLAVRRYIKFDFYEYCVLFELVGARVTVCPRGTQHFSECRGIIFCEKTGQVLARRFHKFFNVNEQDETQAELIDLARPHFILEKADGFVSPVPHTVMMT